MLLGEKHFHHVCAIPRKLRKTEQDAQSSSSGNMMSMSCPRLALPTFCLSSGQAGMDKSRKRLPQGTWMQHGVLQVIRAPAMQDFDGGNVNMRMIIKIYSCRQRISMQRGKTQDVF
jgi:hypothetical protein